MNGRLKQLYVAEGADSPPTEQAVLRSTLIAFLIAAFMTGGAYVQPAGVTGAPTTA